MEEKHKKILQIIGFIIGALGILVALIGLALSLTR